MFSIQSASKGHRKEVANRAVAALFPIYHLSTCSLWKAFLFPYLKTATFLSLEKKLTNGFLIVSGTETTKVVRP